jgi:hypothetical protein
MVGGWGLGWLLIQGQFDQYRDAVGDKLNV